MSDESKAAPTPEQVVRAGQLREAIANIKRGVRPAPKTPRDLAQQAAVEASRRAKTISR